MNTRKYPRTLNEAFGPYANQCRIEEPRRQFDWQDRVVLAGSVITAVIVAGFVLVGWIV